MAGLDSMLSINGVALKIIFEVGSQNKEVWVALN